MNIKLPAVVSTTVKRSNKSNNSSNKNCQFMARMRMISVVLSIGAGSMFLVREYLFLESVTPSTY